MRVLISGGASMEHVDPALSIASELVKRDPSVEILFVGTKNGVESKIVPQAGYDYKPISADYFEKKFSVKNITKANKLIGGFTEANKIIDEFVPDLVLGTGGYVSGPVVLMANLKGVKTAVHEQKKAPGKTSKILSRFVDRVFTSHEESNRYFKNHKKLICTGNPGLECGKASGNICNEIEKLMK